MAASIQAVRERKEGLGPGVLRNRSICSLKEWRTSHIHTVRAHDAQPIWQQISRRHCISLEMRASLSESLFLYVLASGHQPSEFWLKSCYKAASKMHLISSGLFSWISSNAKSLKECNKLCRNSIPVLLMLHKNWFLYPKHEAPGFAYKTLTLLRL